MLNRSFDYESQIKKLTEDPSLIYDEWMGAKGIFKLMGSWLEFYVGCPTMIRTNDENKECGFQYYAFIGGFPHHEFTEQLSKDTRLPKDSLDITVEHLPIFAEWQEKYDELVSAAKQTQTI